MQNFRGVFGTLKRFHGGYWPRQNNFSGVIDAAEIYMTPLKFQIAVKSANYLVQLAQKNKGTFIAKGTYSTYIKDAYFFIKIIHKSLWKNFKKKKVKQYLL
jgi:hypothetical protein